MSTTYYQPRGRIAPDGDVWAVYADDGTRMATVLPEGLYLLIDRDAPVAHRSGGTISVTGTGLDGEWCISENGEPVTLGDLRRGVAP